MPQLSVEVVGNKLYQGRVNMNEEQEFILHYSLSQQSSSRTVLFYSGVLIYENSVVATINNIGFSQFKMRVWNHYSNFNSTNQIMLRLSVYNPQFYMPSLTTLSIQINLPPQDCQVAIQPSSGIVLITPF